MNEITFNASKYIIYVLKLKITDSISKHFSNRTI